MPTHIQWTEETLNVVTGCDRVSPGCDNCLGLDTRVLGLDMQWRPIADVQIGDDLLGFTDAPSLGANRVWEASRVEAIRMVQEPTVRFTLANGRAITCSGDHRFLAHPRPSWRKAGRFNFDTRLRTIGDPDLCPILGDPAYMTGYIAGATEGDGTFRWDPSWRSSTLGYPQSYWRVAVLADDQPVLTRLCEYLSLLGVEVNIRPFDSGRPGRPMLKVETRKLADMPILDSFRHERSTPEWRQGWLAGIFDT